jgi:hypothetical protein
MWGLLKLTIEEVSLHEVIKKTCRLVPENKIFLCHLVLVSIRIIQHTNSIVQGIEIFWVTETYLSRSGTMYEIRALDSTAATAAVSNNPYLSNSVRSSWISCEKACWKRSNYMYSGVSDDKLHKCSLCLVTNYPVSLLHLCLWSLLHAKQEGLVCL